MGTVVIFRNASLCSPHPQAAINSSRWGFLSSCSTSSRVDGTGLSLPEESAFAHRSEDIRVGVEIQKSRWLRQGEVSPLLGSSLWKWFRFAMDISWDNTYLSCLVLESTVLILWLLQIPIGLLWINSRTIVAWMCFKITCLCVLLIGHQVQAVQLSIFFASRPMIRSSLPLPVLLKISYLSGRLSYPARNHLSSAANI